MKKKIAPGRIYARKLITGSYLYYTVYKDDTRYSSGLLDTPQNRDIISKIQEKAYLEYISSTGKVIAKDEDNNYYILDLWQQYYERELSNKEARTIESYSRAKRLLITRDVEINEKERINNTYLSKVELMIKTNIDLLKSKLAGSTINIQIRSVQAFLNWCYSNYYLKDKILLSKYKFKTEQKEIVSYGTNELEVINEIYKKDKEFALYMLLMGSTGLRMTETLQLLWSQIDFDKNIIHLKNKIKKHEYDTIPMTKIVKEILIELKEVTNKRGYKQDKVFRWEASSSSRLIKRFTTVLELKGIKHKGTAFHGFRKMFLNKVAQIPNLSILDFQKIARIRDVKTAHNHYLQKENDRLIEILDK